MSHDPHSSHRWALAEDLHEIEHDLERWSGSITATSTLIIRLLTTLVRAVADIADAIRHKESQ